MPKTTTIKRGRDAESGQFVPIEYANKHPKTTVVETIKIKKNGVKVEGYGLVGLVAEVGEVEGDAGGFTLNAGHKLADLNLVFDSIDEYHIIGIGMIDVDTGVKLEFHMQSIDAATGKLHPGDRASGEQQARKVDMYHTVVVGEAMLVYAGELVVLDMPVGMSLFGSPRWMADPRMEEVCCMALKSARCRSCASDLLSVNDLVLLRLNCLPKRV